MNMTELEPATKFAVWVGGRRHAVASVASTVFLGIPGTEDQAPTPGTSTGKITLALPLLLAQVGTKERLRYQQHYEELLAACVNQESLVLEGVVGDRCVSYELALDSVKGECVQDYVHSNAVSIWARLEAIATSVTPID
jgi:hypothetical protein